MEAILQWLQGPANDDKVIRDVTTALPSTRQLRQLDSTSSEKKVIVKLKNKKTNVTLTVPLRYV